jgi:hypothetical protein
LGKERIVRRSEIAELLALTEVNIKEHPLSGADHVVIRRSRSTLNPEP